MKRRQFVHTITAAAAGLLVFKTRPVDEYDVQEFEKTGKVVGGTFTMASGGKITEPLPYNATADQINAELSRIGSPYTIKSRDDLV